MLDTSKDKMGGLNKTHQNSVQVIHEYQNALDLVDVWRTLNKDDRRTLGVGETLKYTAV